MNKVESAGIVAMQEIHDYGGPLLIKNNPSNTQAKRCISHLVCPHYK